MRIVNFELDPISRIPYLNAGRRPNQFFPDTVLVYRAAVDEMPAEIDAIVVTADLQGREPLPNRKRSDQGLRLLGEVMPEILDPILGSLGCCSGNQVAAILAGDFYTYPDLRGRGGTGDVTSVWQTFSDAYRWVVGVAGNHDTFGEHADSFSRPNAHFLDGQRVELSGIRLAGISGVIGNPRKNFRRTHDQFVADLDGILLQPTDIALMHEGPDAPQHCGCRGLGELRAIVEHRKPGLVIRGHRHWPIPFVELPGGVQILNVDATVVILTR